MRLQSLLERGIALILRGVAPAHATRNPAFASGSATASQVRRSSGQPCQEKDGRAIGRAARLTGHDEFTGLDQMR